MGVLEGWSKIGKWERKISNRIPYMIYGSGKFPLEFLIWFISIRKDFGSCVMGWVSTRAILAQFEHVQK